MNMEMSVTPPGGGLGPRAEISSAIHRTLHQAARDGDVRVMRYLLDRLGNQAQRKINHLDEDELSPLHYAARYNFYDMVTFLVERGADVNIRGEDGLAPLHFAARYKKTKTIRLHASGESSGAQSETEEAKGEDGSGPTSPIRSLSPDGPGVYQRFKTFAGQNPINHYRQRKPYLHRGMFGDSKDEPKSPDSAASYSITTSVILYMAWQGASVNAKDNFGLTPLHYAAMRCNEVAAKELLMCVGINAEAHDRQMMTPLHIAAVHNSVEVARLLIDSDVSLRSIDSTLATPLHRASMEGNMDIVHMLLEAADKDGGWVGVSQMVSDQDLGQNLPLHLAIENVKVELVELLIGKGSDTNISRHNFVFPLHLAAVSGKKEIVELLLENNARVDCLNASQETPLHRAAEYNHTEVIEYLLLKGAKIERRNKDNFTPLLIAACKGHVGAIQCLLDRGADVTAMDKNDKTALYWAAEGNNFDALMTLMDHEKCKELLDRCDRYGNSPLHTAAMKGYLPIVQYLLDQGAIIDHKNEEEETPLHLAAKEGRTKIVKELVRRCKQLANNEDEDSNTPLHLAALAGNDKVIKTLLESGANIESRNSNQWTALDCACVKGWLQSVKVLLDAGSAVEPPAKIKTTPLHLAASRGHVAVVELLMDRGAHVDRTDELGRNALELAIEDSHKSVAMAIIDSSQWQEALRNYCICPKTGARRTPLRRLILKLPEVAEKVFNKCISTNTFPSEHPNFAVTFSYEFLDDTYIVNDKEIPSYNYYEKDIDLSASKVVIYDDDYHVKPEAAQYSENATLVKENHPLMIMVNSKRKQLLGHPLCMSLVQFKWLQYGRYVYYTNLAFYAFFLTFLTGYLLTTPQPTLITRSDTNVSQVPCEEIKRQNLLAGQNWFANIGKVVVIVLCSLMLIKECFQIFHIRLRYMSFENFLEWLCYISALLLVIDMDCFSAATGHRKEWQWELGAFSIFLAWLDLVMFIRKFPFLGIYVVMLTDVFTTFVKVFAVFFLLIIGFGLSFSTIFYNQETMLTPSKTLLRTSVMMLGEFNFDEMFDDNEIIFPAPSYIIFIAFIILMPIITMNLLVGLAVDDIKGVQEQAELKRLAMQVELVLNVEAVMPEFLRRKFMVYQQSIKPNKRSHSYIKHVMSGLENLEVYLSYGSKVATKPETERSEEQHEAIMARMNHMEHSVLQLREENRRLQSLLLTLIKDKGLQWEDEDEITEIAETSLSSHH